MRVKHLRTGLALLALVSGGSACAMNAPTTGKAGCTVEGSEKLPSGTGGADAVCGAIGDAVANALGAEAAAQTSTIVRVRSAHSLAASVTAPGGRKLPEIQVTISDSELNRRSVLMLAEQIASQLASMPGVKRAQS